MTQLVTGEAVALDLRPAALPSRLLAALLDALLQGVLLVVLLIATSYAGTGSDAASAALSILVIVLGTVAYPVAFETALRGRTPGKAALGLRAVRDDGGPIGFRQALVRGLAGAFLERPGITFFFGALVCSLLHPSGKRIGDVLAGTVVLRERVPSRGGAVAVMPPPLAGWAASLAAERAAGRPRAAGPAVPVPLGRAGPGRPRGRSAAGWSPTSWPAPARPRRPTPRAGRCSAPSSPSGPAARRGRRRSTPARRRRRRRRPWLPTPLHQRPSTAPPTPGPGGFVLPG